MLKIVFGILLALLFAGLAIALQLVRRARRMKRYNATLLAARAQPVEVRQTAEIDYVIHQIDEQLRGQGPDAPGLGPRLEELRSVILRCRNFQPSELSIGELCNRVVRAHQDLARDHEILYSQSNGESLQAMGDAETLSWALKELLSNVFAHAGEWSRIELNLKPSNGAVILSVHDDGVGPDLSAAARLYSAFTARLGSEGPGLGLFTVRHVVESMGGTIEAKPGASGGLVHTVRLPAMPAEAAESGKTETET